MAWYPLPQAGDTVSAGDEFFETQSAGWSLWSFTAPDDRSTTAGVCSIKQEHGVAPQRSCTGPSEEEQSAPFEEPWFPRPAPDILLSQLFSDEGMRRMDDGPLEELGVFPDSMNMLLSLSSYENMLTGLLTGSEEQGDHAEQLDRNGVVDAMMDNTCGMQNGSRDAGQSSCSNPEMLAAGPSSEEEEQAGLQSMAKRGRAGTGMESTPLGFEALVLEELEDVVFQLARSTRMRFRDAFYRLAESSKSNCSSSSIQQPDGNASSARFSPSPGCPERETNPIDRTVMVLTMEAPRRQLHGSCCAGEDSGAEALTATSWAA